jgi:hypothetical protein
MAPDSASLDFAYKYPFSNQAKEIVNSQAEQISLKYLDMAARRIENANEKTLQYNDISIGSIKVDYVMTYLYSRMLLSAAKRPDLIRTYALAESSRSSQALLMADVDEIAALSLQLGIKITGTFDKRKDKEGIEELSINFMDYIKFAPPIPNFDLVNQKLSSGIVILNKNNMVKIVEQAIIKEITKGLPIKSSELPKQVVDYSKGLKLRATIRIDIKPGKSSEEWIERLLQTPIADVRHRTVNLILAPYLVNVKGFEVEQASKIIGDYIERCKQIDPNTKINDSYIRYQCVYAKKRGLKPLSLDRAKELLGNQVDLQSPLTINKK